MVGFISGLFAGGFLEVFAMCLCNVASRADDEIEKIDHNKETKIMWLCKILNIIIAIAYLRKYAII